MKQEILSLVEEKKKFIYLLDQLNRQEGKHIESHLDSMYGIKEQLKNYELWFYYRTHPSLILINSETNRSSWVFTFALKNEVYRWVNNTCFFRTHFKHAGNNVNKLHAFSRMLSVFLEHKEQIEEDITQIDKTYYDTRREILYQINERNRQISLMWEREIYPKILECLESGVEMEFKEEFRCKYKSTYPSRVNLKKIKVKSISGSKKSTQCIIWNSDGEIELRIKRKKVEELIRKWLHESNQEIIDEYMWVLQQVKI